MNDTKRSSNDVLIPGKNLGDEGITAGDLRGIYGSTRLDLLNPHYLPPEETAWSPVPTDQRPVLAGDAPQQHDVPGLMEIDDTDDSPHSSKPLPEERLVA